MSHILQFWKACTFTDNSPFTSHPEFTKFLPWWDLCYTIFWTLTHLTISFITHKLTLTQKKKLSVKIYPYYSTSHCPMTTKCHSTHKWQYQHCTEVSDWLSFTSSYWKITCLWFLYKMKLQQRTQLGTPISCARCPNNSKEYPKPSTDSTHFLLNKCSILQFSLFHLSNKIPNWCQTRNIFLVKDRISSICHNPSKFYLHYVWLQAYQPVYQPQRSWRTK